MKLATIKHLLEGSPFDESDPVDGDYVSRAVTAFLHQWKRGERQLDDMRASQKIIEMEASEAEKFQKGVLFPVPLAPGWYTSNKSDLKAANKIINRMDHAKRQLLDTPFNKQGLQIIDILDIRKWVQSELVRTTTNAIEIVNENKWRTGEPTAGKVLTKFDYLNRLTLNEQKQYECIFDATSTQLYVRRSDVNLPAMRRLSELQLERTKLLKLETRMYR